MRPIDIELPFYYRFDLMLDYCASVIYGKIEEKKHTAIKINDESFDKTHGHGIEIEVNYLNSISDVAYYSCYMTEEYISNEYEFLEAKNKLILMANNV